MEDRSCNISGMYFSGNGNEERWEKYAFVTNKCLFSGNGRVEMSQYEPKYRGEIG